ncbi:ribosomal lysine N-methyltransferase 3 [Phragmites australis]|uniref:ribosomal lysine N-methyltransferase 3 n=1 Tax=Phragmites australis TaxID=29695 RepID=UPI002D7A388A|nr:ribosomal lysine N-methyltransferase 3 [Phragmites australis]
MDAAAAAAAPRRLRAFKRWMRAHGVVCSDALRLDASEAGGVHVRAVAPLREGDLVTTIPRHACLTPRTTGAAGAIEAAELGGSLALVVAVMYERACGADSPWDAYLRLLPDHESVPLVWPADEAERLLAGTELDKIVKQDREFLCEDWKECIEPLMSSGELDVDPDDFSLEKYFSAKTLVSSRSFQIDSYHGSGMVPLADLFNHKTDGEHVHFTSELDAADSNSEDDDDQSDASADDQSTIENSTNSSGTRVNDEDLEMIIVRDVNEGEEVYNTYGTMGNAALLHRYGFTELDNPYDIVNIDLALVTKWCTSVFSSRHARARVSLWRNLGYSGCTSQDAEYFEISYDGEPQLELLILLYIITLKPDVYDKLICVAHDLTGNEEHDSISSVVKFVKATSSNQNSELNGLEKLPVVKKLLHSENICSALLSLADMRESLYGSNTLEDDEKRLRTCYCVSERELYHSLVLRVSERSILHRLRKYASSWSKTKKRKHT